MDKTKEVISFISESLKAEKFITDLQKAILDTWNESNNQSFDANSMLEKIFENGYNYQEIRTSTISKIIQYMTENKPFAEAELRELLSLQLDILISKELTLTYNR